MDFDFSQLPIDILHHTLSFLDDESYKNARVSAKFFKTSIDARGDFLKRKLYSQCIKQVACGYNRTFYLLNNGTVWEQINDENSYKKIDFKVKIKRIFTDENIKLDIACFLDSLMLFFLRLTHYIN